MTQRPPVDGWFSTPSGDDGRAGDPRPAVSGPVFGDGPAVGGDGSGYGNGNGYDYGDEWDFGGAAEAGPVRAVAPPGPRRENGPDAGPAPGTRPAPGLASGAVGFGPAGPPPSPAAPAVARPRATATGGRRKERTGPGGPAGPGGSGTSPAAAGAAAPGAAKRTGRDRYLDLLRSIALVRVVVYHLFGWAWLTVLFPSMGVMFALAGSLMARSLSRPALSVIRGRLRRLLPPMWLFGAVVLVLLYLAHWDPGADEGRWGWAKLLNYVVPVGAPPYSDDIGFPGGLFSDSTWADEAAGPLWYIRAYLWFVLASPLLLWAFRRVPWATLLAPLALTGVIGTGLVEVPGETGLALTDFAVYGSCWVLGMAHQEGVLQRVPRYMAVSCATITMAFGLWWAHGHLTEEGWNLDDIPLAQATWSLGFVVILLQYSPSWRELPGRLARWDKLVTLSNNRAVTIYLWHNALIMLTFPLIDLAWRLPFMTDRLGEALDKTYMFWSFVLVWPLIGLSILAVGWIEDLAAKRRPRLWPNGTERLPRAERRTERRAVHGGRARRARAAGNDTP